MNDIRGCDRPTLHALCAVVSGVVSYAEVENGRAAACHVVCAAVVAVLCR